MKFFKSKTSIIFAVVFIVIAGSIAGFFVLSNNNGNDGQDISMLTWNTYRDEENGFTFEYPSSWEVLLVGSELQVRDITSEKLAIKISGTSGVSEGLDAGRIRLAYKIDTSSVPEEERKFMTEGLRGRTKKRLRMLGLQDVSLSESGLKVEYTDSKNGDAVKQAVVMAPTFEFQEVKEQYRNSEDFREEDLNDLFQKTSLTGQYLMGAELRLNPPIVDLMFDETGAEMLHKITQRNLGLPLAIVLDGEIIAAPTISEPIVGGTVRLEGVFNPGEALENAGEVKALIYSPSIYLRYEIACKEEGERECRGRTWSEDGAQVLAIEPSTYIEVHKKSEENSYVLFVIADSEDSFEMEVFNRIASSFQFEP